MKSGHPIRPDPTAHQRMGGNPAEQERNSGTQPDADQNRRRREAPFVRSQQRTAQRPFGRLALLQLNRERAASVRATRIVASCSAVTTQKHPTNGRKTSVASWNLISARSTTLLLMLISGRKLRLKPDPTFHGRAQPTV